MEYTYLWQNRQFSSPKDDTLHLDKHGIKLVQQIVGIFLVNLRAIDNTILTALNEIVAHQAVPTELTNENITMLLDYLSTYPDAKIRFNTSNMILRIESDTAYLVAPKARSHIAGM